MSVEQYNTLDFLFYVKNLSQQKPFRAYMASSYDREGGNYDWGNYDLIQGEEATVLDVEGPGMITRLWSANPDGNIKIFLDGNDSPVIDESLDSLLRRLPMQSGHGYLKRGSAEFEAVIKSEDPLGMTCYCLIPFQNGCKVIFYPVPNIYYQINYLLWDEPHGLPSFSNERVEDLRKEYERLWKYLSWEIEETKKPAKSGEISLKAGEKAVVFDQSGSFTIENLQFSIPYPENKIQQQHIRENLLLRAYWDEDLDVTADKTLNLAPNHCYHPKCSIKSPLAFFFMDFGELEKYRTSLISKNANCYACRFPMPVARRGVIEIVNNSCVDIENIKYEIQSRNTRWTDETCHFKSLFHAENSTFGPDFANYSDNVMYMRNQTGELNYPVLRTWGEGHFIGCCFYVDYSETPFPRSLCESDEAVFIDDNRQQTMWGTGNEDYVNDAWGFHKRTGNLSGGYYFINNVPSMFGYRFHISDCIPFKKKLVFSLEHGSSNNCSAFYRSVAYYYLKENGETIFIDGVPPRKMNRYFSI